MIKKATTKILSALLTVVMLLLVVPLSDFVELDLFATKASALVTGKCGYDVTYSLYSDGLLFIGGKGNMNSYNNTTINSPFYGNNDIETVVFTSGVTSIGARVFAGCSGIKSITIPDSVTSIGKEAFASCKGLTEISYNAVDVKDLTSGSYVFFLAGTSGKGIKVTIGNSVKRIPANLFAGCGSLTSVTFGNNITSIGDFAFSGCIGIKNFDFPSTLKNIGHYAFQHCIELTNITIPDCVTTIGSGAFESCNKLASIIIPEGITSIGKDILYDTLFYNNNSNWEDNVLYIGDYLISIQRDKYLNALLTGTYNIKPGTKVIAWNAFEYCHNLTNVTIPNSVINIGEFAFSNCDRLASITIGNGINSIGCYAFLNTEYYNNITNWKDDVLYIGDYFIQADDSIMGSYEIKFGTKIIADAAFKECRDLTNVSIPDSVTAIGLRAFVSCYSLTSLTIPDSVTSIGEFAFGYNDYNYNDYHYTQKSSNFVIYCYKGTAGEKYAVENDFNYELICTHNWSEWTTTKAETCTEDGIQTRTCLLCMHSETQVVSATGHTVVVDNAVAPTCTTTGLAEGSHCSVCDAIITAQETISATGHTVVVDNAVAPTCTTTGLTEGSHCSVCDAIITAQEVVPALGHSYGLWTVTTAPTCTEDGIETHYCSRCDHSETQAVPATGHTVVVDNAVAPTCTTTGLTAGSHCSVCDEIITAQEIISATGHTFGAWTVVSPATTEREGLEERTCHCGERETRSIPKLPTKVISVKLNNKNVDTNYNRSFTLKPNIEVVGTPRYKVEYTSSNTDVATVDSNGNVKTVGKGNATITVTVTDSLGNVVKDTCNVNVTFTFAQWLLYIICFGWIWM